MRRLARCERGANALEFAIVGPVAIVLLLMIIETALLFNTWLGLQHEAREAARFGIAGAQVNASTPPNMPALRAATYAYAQGNIRGLLGADLPACSGTGESNCIAVQIQTDAATGYPTEVSVTARYTATTVTPVLQSIVTAVPLVAEASMRAE